MTTRIQRPASFVMFATLLCLIVPATSFAAEQDRHVQVGTAGELDVALKQIQHRRESGDSAAVVIRFRPGTIRLRSPLVINQSMVGEGLMFEAIEQSKTSFSGAVQLTPHRKEGRYWVYQVPETETLNQSPTVLLVNQKLRRSARHPNVGYFRIEAAHKDRRSGFRFRAGDIPADVNPQDAPCQLVFLHDWSSSRLPVREIDHDNRQLRTVGPIGCSASHYAIDHFEKQPRYYLEGHRAFADLAGEWIYDAERRQVLVVAGSEKEAPSIELPILEQLITTAGPNASPIKNVVFRGVRFTGTSFPKTPGGLAGAQATMHEPRDGNGDRLTKNRPMLSAAIHLEQANQIHFEHCTFAGLGNTALWIGGRCNDCVVSDCQFQDIGGNGINLGENNDRRVDEDSWYRSAPQQVPTNNRIENCKIRHCGQVLSGSVAIWAALNRRLQIADNEISDCPYTGISLGWIWNPTPSPAKENVISGNRISRVMQVLSDGGGIYTLGNQPGSVLRNNVITNVPLNAGRAESNGMFLDEGTSGFEITGNTFRRIAKSPLRFHRAGQNSAHHNHWELETDRTPPVRYNNTPEKNVLLSENEVLPRQPRIFLIGNSLTWDTRPPLLDDYVDWHVDCGKSLQFIHDRPADPCVASSRHWPIALAQLQYDVLSVQPHYGTSLDEDVEAISAWMKMQPAATLLLHSGWARSETVESEYASKVSDMMTHNVAYLDALKSRLQERFPDRMIRETHCTDALHRIDQDIRSARAPLSDLEQLYRDAIHMTDGEGRFLMHNLMRKAIGQPFSEEGFDLAKRRPDLHRYLLRVIGEVGAE
ncbi:right-handed parallel beta-helix repeat-containing protein [Roseiconus lacunae]|uniref:right-handed parallel beta-helix repeat-containing protein n=1 Tax=Roseiconus lacunae TaxID=2605694 RepID=UPI0011F3CCB2|nr:right-handed parallel beta-helix repeat-containing protein [Roseiconus lacunae]